MIFSGKSDPYAKVKFDDDVAVPEEGRTHTINNTLTPEWNVFFPFLVKDDCKSYKVSLYDEDVGKDDKLGHANVLRKEGGERYVLSGDWYYLEGGKGATVEVFQQEFDISNGLGAAVAARQDALKEYVASKKRSNYYLLSVTVHGAKGLKSGMIDKSDPYAKFDFSGDSEGDGVHPKSLKTRTIDNNPSPVWEESFVFIIPSGLKAFKIEVMDEDTGGDDSLGHISVPLPAINEHVKNKRYAVSKKGEVELSMVVVPAGPLLG